MPSPRPSIDRQIANDAAIAQALAADEVKRTTPSPAKAGSGGAPEAVAPTAAAPSAPPLLPGDSALAADAQAAEDAAGAAFYDTTANLTRARTSEDPCASDAALAYALQEAESEAAAAAARWAGSSSTSSVAVDAVNAAADATAATAASAARLLASAFAGPWHAVCSAATNARLAGQRLGAHHPRPVVASAAASADVPAERRRLDATLRAHSLVERVVTGDGACQFRAAADQLYGTENYHSAVREVAVRQLAAHPGSYSPFVSGEPYESYVRRMASPREWGDAITLQALADAYGVRVVVVSSYAEQPFIEVTPAGCGEQEKGAPPTTRTLFLSFFAEVHYNSVYAAPRVAMPGGDGGGSGFFSDGTGGAPWTPERARRQVESEQG